MKQVLKIYPAPPKHWVGDGFFVHGMFNYAQRQKNLDPFLLMDYAAPHYFDRNLTATPKGVDTHPHRGFETVTIAYQGEVTHTDSTGATGTIKAGDVQWMTAGSGVMHQEYHSKTFSQQGGVFEMVQLWVNLPAKDKMTTPKYQAISQDKIPTVPFASSSHAKVIAGDFAGTQGAADTFSPINLWDIDIKQHDEHIFSIPKSHNLLIFVLSGAVKINDKHTAHAAELVTFERSDSNVKIHALCDAKILLMSGEPLDEPIVGYGPFVMNTHEQIAQAISDVRSGKFGQIDT